MAKFKIHRKVKVRNGYEISSTLFDGNESRSKTFFWLGDKEPTDEKLATRMDKMQKRFAEKNKIIPDVSMMKSEVEELLVKKGYLEQGQALDDLKDKEVV